jgi:dihydroorotate dehydrogenase
MAFPMKVSITYLGKQFENPFVLASGCQDTGADILQLNFSSPNGYPEKGIGAAASVISSHKESLPASITKNIRSLKLVNIQYFYGNIGK